MQQEKEIPSIKTSAVARAVKEIGQFMLMDIDEGCFLVIQRNAHGRPSICWHI